MSPLSILCIAGYALAGQIAIWATGASDDILAQSCYMIGVIPVGYWCGYCDEREDT